VVGSGKDIAEARERAYRTLTCVSFAGMHRRSDIAG
jgi:phosphoribosylamine-glycine ligase